MSVLCLVERQFKATLLLVFPAPREVSIIQRGLESFHDVSCLRFVKRTNQRDYLNIQSLNGYACIRYCTYSLGNTLDWYPVVSMLKVDKMTDMLSQIVITGATLTSAVVTTDRICPCSAQVVFTTTRCSMRCSTHWVSTMSRNALTGTSTSASCWRTSFLVCLFTTSHIQILSNLHEM